MDKAVKELYDSLNKNYKKLLQNKYYCEDILKEINKTQLFKIYEEKYQAYLASIGGNKKIGGHIKDNKTLYVFVDKGMSTLSVNGMEYYGYTFGARNSAFVFNQHVTERKFGTFAHEIAHSLGLDHTFELNEKEYRPNKTIDNDIKEKEGLLDGKNKTNDKQISTNTADVHKKFNGFMKDLDALTDNEKIDVYKNDFQKKGYYREVNIRLNYIQNSGDFEKESQIGKLSEEIVDSDQNLKKEILDLKSKKEKNKSLYINVAISETQENFMDYDYTESIDATTKQNVPNPNFEPKSFWKWQWESLQTSKFLIKKDL